MISGRGVRVQCEAVLKVPNILLYGKRGNHPPAQILGTILIFLSLSHRLCTPFKLIYRFAMLYAFSWGSGGKRPWKGH